MSMAGPANLNRSMICAETASTKWTSAAGVSEDGRKAAFLPFSGGPIDCVGHRLAMMMVRPDWCMDECFYCFRAG